VLSRQLRALPADKPSIASLTEAGKYCELADLWLQVDSMYDELDFEARDVANARRVHDVLMLMLCFREHPVTRPTCIRLLLAPGEEEECIVCDNPSCLGNSWHGKTAVIRHHKTSGTYGEHRIKVVANSRTDICLDAYVNWARSLLVQEETSALFLTTRGRAFKSDTSFNKYLPRLLAPVAELSWTRVRAPAAALWWLAHVLLAWLTRERPRAAAAHHGHGLGASRHRGAAGGAGCLHADQVSSSVLTPGLLKPCFAQPGS